VGFGSISDIEIEMRMEDRQKEVGILLLNIFRIYPIPVTT
jgi:hypothetical protein